MQKLTPLIPLILILLMLAGCSSQQENEILTINSVGDKMIGQASKEQETEIRLLIEQLVFADTGASHQPVVSPGIADNSIEYRKRFEACQNAFQKLADYRGLAFPLLIEHLDDKRQSINFRNHHLANSVGDACYWIIYLQLQDRPPNYSRYGYSRQGRDGKDHPKPYWEGTPFDDAGGLRQWLENNKNLSYQEMQIKCLSWLLAQEKRIGAPDADSYFLNILPLEIRILERRLENGEDVKSELVRMMKIRDKRLVNKIPPELLPPR